MSIRVSLHHETTYRYDRKISLGPQLIRLRPAYHARTKIAAYSLRVEPDNHFINWQQDPFGNPVARLVFPNRTEELKITVGLQADLTVINPFDFFILESAKQWPFSYERTLGRQLGAYLEPGELTPELSDWLKSIPSKSDSLVNFLVDVNRKLYEDIRYVVRMEPGVQSPERTLALKSGSCRDSAWLLVEIFRQIGIAARFVSGYLIQLKADQTNSSVQNGPKEDFTDLHAWTEVFVPGAGWIGLDPTSGLFAGEGHIPLACTPSFEAAAPITGAHDECEVQFDHVMSVDRFYEGASVTKPYTDQEWRSILDTGHQVDQSLKRNDVRLTMGGEPTFVSLDNSEDPQWNTDAVGEEKRVLSNLLLLRLRDQFAPGGLLHYGQGKWYPGESLPRWALSCIWRRDGEPIWQNPRWLADEGSDYGLTIDDAQRFLRHLTHKLGIESKLTFPVYEDTFHYLWKEGKLPTDVDPLDPIFDDPNERSMMIRAFSNGFSKPVGFILPLKRAWWQTQCGWVAGRWPVRRGKVFLVPGDSPIGLRLPIESLPEEGRRQDQVGNAPLDPTERQRPLREPKTIHAEPTCTSVVVNDQVLDESGDGNPLTGEGDVVRTALCVECRNGRIHVFMPPTQRADDYLDLIAAVEQTCVNLKVPVIIEGYLPPSDHRLEFFKVTPDPGVIEVNTHPTCSWENLVSQTETLYREAMRCGLGTSKFDIDGRQTGTGGGSHVVLGGGTPLDSPFLRRPDLLASMVAFWNNHPSLSYLFSGRFIGPTSQAPRLDESRADAVYEMEIALAQVPHTDQVIPPWLVDRLFRDLLTDLTGNTHRAEICIDKLYSPDSSTGRLGLVELRGFEMPVHARMQIAQQLLIRAIVASFWEKPYHNEPLVNWRGALHDRFMLPHFIWQDFQEVIQCVSCDEFQLDANWYLPHLSARFPEIGQLHRGGVMLELRTAIEPWHVMGEDPGGGGTVRFVDSSLERLQVLVNGFQPERHQIWCNGVVVPMHDTGTPGQYIAGLRYRAWQPPRCLHPTIPVQSPLRFEIVDRPNSLSLGGCTYHVTDPSGRATERYPVNANEAEARRAARFEEIGFTGGNLEAEKVSSPRISPRISSAYPVTCDLRRFSF